MPSQHDVFAGVFDLVHASFNNRAYFQKELEFLMSHLPPRASILDLGCGTGRHLVPLAKAGYAVTGVENSLKLVRVFQEKLRKEHVKARIVNNDVNRMEALPATFDGIICFWNSFCEMALDKKQALGIISLAYKSLNQKGVLIIEQTNMPSFDPKKIEFATTLRKEDKHYLITFAVASYDKKNRTSASEQKVSIYKGRNHLETIKGKIIQRWWQQHELVALMKQAGFTHIRPYGGDFASFKEPTDKLILLARKY